MKHARAALHTVGSVAFVAVIAVAITAAPSHGQPPDDVVFSINHFDVYDVPNTVPSVGPVQLRDQFGTSQHLTGDVHWFGLPTNKNFEGVVDPRAHLLWRRLLDSEIDPIRPVVVQNQFGDQTLEVGDAEYLLIPALKNSGPSGENPLPEDTHDHYKCYQAAGDPISREFTYENQFEAGSDATLAPAYLCNPAEKTTESGVTPIRKPTEHLVCYFVRFGTTTELSLVAFDQFGQWNIALQSRKMLCVPSLKDEVVQTLEGTWGQIKSTYR